jgi:hypothetical protein
MERLPENPALTRSSIARELKQPVDESAASASSAIPAEMEVVDFSV